MMIYKLLLKTQPSMTGSLNYIYANYMPIYRQFGIYLIKSTLPE
jgi:hypothetical protein